MYLISFDVYIRKTIFTIKITKLTFFPLYDSSLPPLCTTSSHLPTAILKQSLILIASVIVDQLTFPRALYK